jgi:signal peptidase II
MNRRQAKIFSPLILTAAIAVLDQASKFWIGQTIGPSDQIPILGSFFNLVLVRNPGIAFSIGKSLPMSLRQILLVLLPLIALMLLLIYYFRTKTASFYERFLMAGILGGGLGNILDRLIRADSLIDFLSIKFYGMFGIEYLPAFNFADSAIFICCILLFIAYWRQDKKSQVV